MPLSIPSFKNKQLLDQVFTHRSYLNETNEKLESNERMEFLGDSILSFIVSSFIFSHYNNLKEGELTNLRSILTNTDTLGSVAQKLNLGKQLKLSRGEEAGGGRENKSILANTFEALVGGLYLDQGTHAVQKFIEEVLLSNIEKLIREEGLKDPKSKLQEILQDKYRIAPAYKIMKEEGPDHAKMYTVGVYVHEKLLAVGVGKSKQEAEKNAARNALSSQL